jgi:hypothetical protein
MRDPVDHELHLTAGLAGQRRDELVAEGQPVLADYLHHVAVAAAELRDERRAVAREVDEAANPFQVLGAGILPDDEPADPKRDARLAAAVAEWQQDRATPAKTKIRCPAGHSTSLRLLGTAAGLLLVAHPPVPVARSSDPRPLRFAALVDHGVYEVGCARCDRPFRLDVAAVRRAVQAGARMYLAT